MYLQCCNRRLRPTLIFRFGFLKSSTIFFPLFWVSTPRLLRRLYCYTLIKHITVELPANLTISYQVQAIAFGVCVLLCSIDPRVRKKRGLQLPLDLLQNSPIWARGKRRGFSPGAAARHRSWTRVPTDLYILFFLAFCETLFPILFTPFLRLDVSSQKN